MPRNSKDSIIIIPYMPTGWNVDTASYIKCSRFNRSVNYLKDTFFGFIALCGVCSVVRFFTPSHRLYLLRTKPKIRSAFFEYLDAARSPLTLFVKRGHLIKIQHWYMYIWCDFALHIMLYKDIKCTCISTYVNWAWFFVVTRFLVVTYEHNEEWSFNHMRVKNVTYVGLVNYSLAYSFQFVLSIFIYSFITIQIFYRSLLNRFFIQI